MSPPDTDIEQAAQRMQAALTERVRLLALGGELAARRETAAKALTEAKAAGAHADTQTILAPTAERAKWLLAADAEAAKAADAEREINRVANAESSVPGLLAQADDEIKAAHDALSSARTRAADATRQELAAQIRAVAAELGRLLQLGHALAAGGMTSGAFLRDTRIENPCSQRPFIAGHTMTLNDETLFLDKTWRADPEAVALFERHVRFLSLHHQAESHIRRIEDSRFRTLREANRAGFRRSFITPPPQYADRNAEASATGT